MSCGGDSGLVLGDSVAEESFVGLKKRFGVIDLSGVGEGLDVGVADVEDDGLLAVGGGVSGSDLGNFRGAELLPRGVVEGRPAEIALDGGVLEGDDGRDGDARRKVGAEELAAEAFGDEADFLQRGVGGGGDGGDQPLQGLAALAAGDLLLLLAETEAEVVVEAAPYSIVE